MELKYNMLKNKNKKSYPAIAGFFLLIFLGALVWLIVVKYEGSPPTVAVDQAISHLPAAKEMTLTLADPDSGLRKVWIGLVQGGKEVPVFEKTYPRSSFLGRGTIRKEPVNISLAPKKLGFTDGKAIFRLAVWDYSWRNWWDGNVHYDEMEVVIDTTAPEVDVLTRAHNINRGGAGLVVYRLSEPCRQAGVMVGDRFFPGQAGYFEDAQVQLALFAMAHNQGADTQMYVIATDSAGNGTRSGFPHFIRRKRFKKDRIQISNRFLGMKLPEMESLIQSPSGTSPVEKFLQINRRLRQANAQKIQQLTRQPEPAWMWKGRFQRLPNAANRAGFADHRTYFFDGKEIDQQYHLGIDLASLSRSKVPAGNDGKVRFAGPIGIYGKTVLLDHGFGLFSLYAHLSQIEVAVGDMVAKGKTIGRTGMTGLAGGDHLHFSMLVHGTFVNPIEWWDPAWIENNITGKLKALAGQLPLAAHSGSSQ